MKVSKEIFELCEVLNNFKAQNIVVCNTTKLSNPVDFLVFATATSSVNAKSILDNLVCEIESKDMFEVLAKEGSNTSEWFVLDLGVCFVNIFTEEVRNYYNLEKLFNEGNNLFTFEKLKKEYNKELEKEQKKLNKNK